MGGVEHVPLSRRSGPFAVLAAVGLVVGAVAVRSAGLYIQFSNTDTARWAADVGAGMLGFVVAAGILVILGLVAAVDWERNGVWRSLTGAAAAAALALVLLGVAEARAYTAMHNFGPQVAAVSRFGSPPGWGARALRTEASETPEAAGAWQVAGGFEAVRDQAVAAFTAWADPGTVVPRRAYTPEYAVMEARRGRDRVELSAASTRYRPGFVRVEATASRLPPWQS